MAHARFLHCKIPFLTFVFSKCLVGRYFETLHGPSPPSSAGFGLPSCFLLERILTVVAAKPWCSTVTLLSTAASWHSVGRKSFPFLHHSVTDVSMDSWVLILFNGLLSVTNISDFDVQIIPHLPTGSPFNLAFCLFSECPCILCSLPNSLALGCSRFILYFSSSPFPKELWFLSVELGVW